MKKRTDNPLALVIGRGMLVELCVQMNQKETQSKGNGEGKTAERRCSLACAARWPNASGEWRSRCTGWPK